jgi:drug/metabolite transporter (DMT)-like permease
MAAFWGGTFVAIKYLLSEMTPTPLIVLRFWISAVIFIIFLAFSPKPEGKIPRNDLIRLILASLSGVVCYQFALNFGERFVSAGTSSLIVATHPIITTVGAALLLGEKVTRRKSIGFLIAIVGLLMVSLWGTGQINLSGTLKGILLVLAAPVSWSTSVLLSRPLSGKYPASWLTSWIMILGAVFMIPAIHLSTFHEAMALTTSGWIAMIFLSLGATFLAYLIWFIGLEHLDSSKVSIYVYLSPFFALLGGALILGEGFTVYSFLGGILIVGGVALTNSR